MKKNSYVHQCVIVILCLIPLQNCGSNHFLKSSTHLVQITKTNNVSVKRSCAHTTEDGVILHGVIERDPHYRSHAWGHVDVALINAEGTIIREESHNFSPSHISPYPVNSHFTAKIALPDDADVTLQVKYHNRSKLCNY